MPSFCSECGEHLKRTRRRWWPARPRCYNCDASFKSGRLLLSGLLLLAMSAGFVAGRYARRPEPFYLIGTPVEPGSLPMASPPDEGRPEPPPKGEAQRGAATSIESTCGAPTRSGKPCRRKVRGGGFCWQHRARDPAAEAR